MATINITTWTSAEETTNLTTGQEEEAKEEPTEESGTATSDSQKTTEYEINDVKTLFAPTEDELYCYDIKVCPDSLPYVMGSKQRAQFYFSVSGMPD